MAEVEQRQLNLLTHTHTTDEGTQPITEDLFEGRSVHVAACDVLTADKLNFTN